MYFGCKMKATNEVWLDVHRILNTVTKRQLQLSHFRTSMVFLQKSTFMNWHQLFEMEL